MPVSHPAPTFPGGPFHSSTPIGEKIDRKRACPFCYQLVAECDKNKVVINNQHYHGYHFLEKKTKDKELLKTLKDHYKKLELLGEQCPEEDRKVKNLIHHYL